MRAGGRRSTQPRDEEGEQPTDHEDRRLKVESFRFDEMTVCSLGPDAATVSGRYTWAAGYDGRPIPGSLRYLRVYTRGTDGWQIRAGQVTPVLPRPD